MLGILPGLEISTEHPLEEDVAALSWKDEHSQQYPTGGNQVC
jgi:hypothetical protein